MSNSAVKSKVSQTASYTCFCRACADAEKDGRFHGPDSIAKVFVPFLPTVLFLKCGPLRKLVMKSVAPRGIYEYVTARTRLFDEVFTAAIDNCLSQTVILGAGFDTRAWRFRQRTGSMRVFELDAPVTQRMKRLLLERRGIDEPEGVAFVPVDFEEGDIASALARKGYRVDHKCLFLMEGVTMYLSWQAVDATFDFIRENSAPGSLVAFDYVLASVLRREKRLYGEAAISKTVFKSGERWIFGIEAGAIGTFLAARGFNLVEHYTPEGLQDKYLTADDGTVYGRVNGTHCVAVAAVAK